MKRIVAGKRAVEELLRERSAREKVSALFADEKTLPQLARLAQLAGVRIEEKSVQELDALAKGVRHQGVIAICGEFSYVNWEEILNQAETPPLLIALDEITDPYNFGAIVRSAVAFGADGILTLKERAAPVTPVVVRASAGATERAKIARVTNLARTLRDLRDSGMQCVGLAAEGACRFEEIPPAPGGRVLVVGSEGKGLRRLVRENCDELVRIDLPGNFESLNASVAAGIALYEASKRRNR